MRSTTKGQHNFARIPSVSIQRSSFDRSCGVKTTFDGGYLVPIFIDESLPGDTMSMQVSTFARLATPIHPIMDNMFMDTFFFAVPMRLIWDNWHKFMGAQDDPGDSTDYLVPDMTTPGGGGGVPIGHLTDYFGVPTEVATDFRHTSIFHRAYNLIWNEWFRDQNLQDSVVVDTDDGPDAYLDYNLLRRGKRHDYITSCLPWPQKGDSVELPLGTVAPVVPTTLGVPKFDVGDQATNELAAIGGSSTDIAWANAVGGSADNAKWATGTGETGLETDLSAATAATINQLREAAAIQRLYEKDARGGSRLTEIIRSHFGVTSPDARLQRPEYLGGGTTQVGITTVPQMSRSEIAFPQGNLAGYGIASSTRHGFTKSFTEHCVIIGMVSVRADLNYQQGLDRMMKRRTRWDFFWPETAHLGEQAVLNSEVYVDGSSADDDVFGYQERFAEYRYKPSKITGLMRSTASTSLDTWHLAQEFGSLPVLGDTFIQDNPPIDRIIAVPSEPHFLFDAYFKYRCARPMPLYGVPGSTSRF